MASVVRFVSLEHVLGRGSELAAPGFEADAAGNMELLKNHLRMLIVGAGGLGCEMLKVCVCVCVKIRDTMRER